MSKYAKAIIAFLAPGAVLLITGSTDGFSTSELAVAGLTCIVTSAGVWAIPNKTVAPKQDQ